MIAFKVFSKKLSFALLLPVLPEIPGKQVKRAPSARKTVLARNKLMFYQKINFFTFEQLEYSIRTLVLPKSVCQILNCFFPRQTYPNIKKE